MQWALWELEMKPWYLLVDVILGSLIESAVVAVDHPDGNLVEVFGGIVMRGGRLSYEDPERKTLH